VKSLLPISILKADCLDSDLLRGGLTNQTSNW